MTLTFAVKKASQIRKVLSAKERLSIISLFGITDIPAHGGSGGSKKRGYAWERRVHCKSCGTYAKFGNELLIGTLAFTTNKGNVISAGQPTPGKDYFEYKAEEGYSICALFGRADRYLNCIGFHAKKIDMDTKDGILNGFRR